MLLADRCCYHGSVNALSQKMSHIYTVSGKKGATLFSTIILAFLGQFLLLSPVETGMNTPQFRVI